MHCCSGRMDIAQKSLQVSNRRHTSYRSQGLWRIQEGFQNFYHKSIIDWFQFIGEWEILKILTSDVIAAALDVDIEQITPAKVIELMEEHGLGNKTSRQGLK